MASVLAFAAVATDLVLTPDERRELTATLRDCLAAFLPFRTRRHAAAP
jgi:hypothetical protein